MSTKLVNPSTRGFVQKYRSGVGQNVFAVKAQVILPVHRLKGRRDETQKGKCTACYILPSKRKQGTTKAPSNLAVARQHANCCASHAVPIHEHQWRRRRSASVGAFGFCSGLAGLHNRHHPGFNVKQHLARSVRAKWKQYPCQGTSNTFMECKESKSLRI